jgi:hypothetical protein
VTATLTSTTLDPNSANNTASASEKSQPAHIGITLTGDPGNPPDLNNVDITDPGSIGWTGSAYNAENPSLAVPRASTVFSWFCTSQGGNLCPAAPGLVTPDSDGLTFPISSFNGVVDTWFIQLEVQLSGDNYVAADGSGTGFAQVSFTTTNSGSD